MFRHITASVVAVALLSAILLSRAVAAPTEAEALADWTALVTLYEKSKEPLGNYRCGFIISDFEGALVEYEKVETELGSEIKKTLGSFGPKYGTKAADIDNTMKKLVTKANTLRNAGYTYEELTKMHDNFVGVRAQTGTNLLKEVEQQLSHMDSYAEGIRQERYAEVKKNLEIAVKYDPTSKAIKEKLDGIDKLAKNAAASVEQQRDERTWPGNFKGFAGPGNSGTLVKEAEKFLVNDPEWSKENLIAVCVKGNWWAVEKNLLGQPIVWGLPVLAAFEDKKDAKNARVFSLSMCTVEGGDKKPPFVGATVGDNFTMRRANVKGGGGGFFGAVFGFWGRIILVLVNLLAGLLAAAPLLTVKAPQLKTVYEKITPLRNLLGVAALGVGLVWFILSLLTFSPLASILPQLSAIAAGLFLGKELLLKKPALDPATSEAGQKAQAATMKAQELFARHQDKIAMLEKFQVPIGIACIVLGLLHLVMGGVTLF